MCGADTNMYLHNFYSMIHLIIIFFSGLSVSFPAIHFRTQAVGFIYFGPCMICSIRFIRFNFFQISVWTVNFGDASKGSIIHYFSHHEPDSGLTLHPIFSVPRPAHFTLYIAITNQNSNIWIDLPCFVRFFEEEEEKDNIQTHKKFLI